MSLSHGLTPDGSDFDMTLRSVTIGQSVARVHHIDCDSIVTNHRRRPKSFNVVVMCCPSKGQLKHSGFQNLSLRWSCWPGFVLETVDIKPGRQPTALGRLCLMQKLPTFGTLPGCGCSPPECGHGPAGEVCVPVWERLPCLQAGTGQRFR